MNRKTYAVTRIVLENEDNFVKAEKFELTLVVIVTTGPLERSNCRVHLRGRCRDFLSDAGLTPG
jgi:hypothetical protein